jgi:hypothetical protein
MKIFLDEGLSIHYRESSSNPFFMLKSETEPGFTLLNG